MLALQFAITNMCFFFSSSLCFFDSLYISLGTFSGDSEHYSAIGSSTGSYTRGTGNTVGGVTRMVVFHLGVVSLCNTGGRLARHVRAILGTAVFGILC